MAKEYKRLGTVASLLEEKENLSKYYQEMYDQKILEHETHFAENMVKLKNTVLAPTLLAIKTIDEQLRGYRSILIRDLPVKDFDPDMFNSHGKVTVMHVKGWKSDKLTIYIEFRDAYVIPDSFPETYCSIDEFKMIRGAGMKSYLDWKDFDGKYSYGTIKICD
ncbi:MAG: hypothetical protein Hyperionvirus23_2 [Hyperionvirus sp.]|uniref:Uncharacterized protein n=1 Tax=Hyperionvirus sp. TaxID=2487770 RepID=A0A3G5AAT4_9VIRU|nr:MAG: hypothetical protein Hyperionvirus23_2 [Hyperionvirus sp.]